MAADFLPNLWESVFTSGPTPTLLLATNVTFAALQLVLALLLAATYSFHFVFLSILCGGLWWSINWFASEVAAVRAEEEAKAREEEKEKKKDGDGDDKEGRKKVGEMVREGGQVGGGDGGDDTGSGADDEGESTEVEDGDGDAGSYGGLGSSRGDLSLSGFEEEGAVVNSGREEDESENAAVRQRNVKTQQQQQGGDLSGEVSTDSEWEKVEDGGR
jgi:hypothetical protein